MIIIDEASWLIEHARYKQSVEELGSLSELMLSGHEYTCQGPVRTGKSRKELSEHATIDHSIRGAINQPERQRIGEGPSPYSASESPSTIGVRGSDEHH